MLLPNVPFLSSVVWGWENGREYKRLSLIIHWNNKRETLTETLCEEHLLRNIHYDPTLKVVSSSVLALLVA
jgi:hypothetical protein